MVFRVDHSLEEIYRQRKEKTERNKGRLRL